MFIKLSYAFCRCKEEHLTAYQLLKTGTCCQALQIKSCQSAVQEWQQGKDLLLLISLPTYSEKKLQICFENHFPWVILEQPLPSQTNRTWWKDGKEHFVVIFLCSDTTQCDEGALLTQQPLQCISLTAKTALHEGSLKEEVHLLYFCNKDT